MNSFLSFWAWDVCVCVSVLRWRKSFIECPFWGGVAWVQVWLCPVLGLEPTEGSSSGRQPASCSPGEARSKGISTEDLGEPAFEPVEPPGECANRQSASLDQRTLEKGSGTQSLAHTTPASLDQEALNSRALPHRSQPAVPPCSISRLPGPLQIPALTSGKAMAPPVGRGLRVLLEIVLITKAPGDLTKACLIFGGLEKSPKLLTIHNHMDKCIVSSVWGNTVYVLDNQAPHEDQVARQIFPDQRGVTVKLLLRTDQGRSCLRLRR